MKKIIKENNSGIAVKPIIPEAVKPGLSASQSINQYYSYYTLMAIDGWLKAVLAHQSNIQNSLQSSAPTSAPSSPSITIKKESS
jgi:hypothetical protein